MSAPVLVADHVSKWYGQVIGLNDVTVSVPPGITGLLGPNGAGKSTFMKLITGQLRPSKGSVTVLIGLIVLSISILERRVRGVEIVT